MTPDHVTVDTDRLAAIHAGELSILGTTRLVRQPTRKIYRQISELDQVATAADLAKAFEVVAWLVPDLTEAELDELTIHHVMAVCAFACGGISAVETLYGPNALSPATSDALPPGSPPDTPTST